MPSDPAGRVLTMAAAGRQKIRGSRRRQTAPTRRQQKSAEGGGYEGAGLMPSVVEHTQGEDKGGTDDAGREEEVSGHSGAPPGWATRNGSTAPELGAFCFLP